MTFRKFASLDNTYNGNIVERVMNHQCSQGDWIATEKVHGANFSFWYDAINGPRIASRTQFVDGSFYGCRDVFNKYVAQFVRYCDEYYNGKEVVVYGELYGGNIQREVRYKDKDFVAFDVVIDGKPMSKIQGRHEARLMGFACTPMVSAGSYSEMLAVSPEFESHLADPFADERFRQAEGLVIEPIAPSYMGQDNRIYFKNKSKSFQERKDCTPKTPKKPVEINTLEGELVYSLMECRVTANRVSAVLSKMGKLTEKEFGKLLGAYTQDIIDEVKREELIDCKSYAGDDWKSVQIVLKRDMLPVLRGCFVAQLED